ncbi:MAG: DUF2851 family protein [Verrucomicrobia bacterium]|nr:MAG: DUF2851 family protein [Verrucomicrobiota bacterium]
MSPPSNRPRFQDTPETIADSVAELVGRHGAFTFPERLMQRIWWRGDFDASALRLRDGRPLRLLRRGRWNHGGGPDFADAELAVGEGTGREVWRGAIEAHLHASDWDQHGHATDPAYDAVVLHVVLFPSMREWTSGANGRRIPILELLPVLGQDLEAYAEEAAVEEIAGRPYSQLREAFSNTPAAELRFHVQHHTDRRWGTKVQLAERRIRHLGWEAACHQSALEVLGYRANRAAMLAVAEALPLPTWINLSPDARAAWVDAALDLVPPSEWVRRGVRPANQPRRRLMQYAQWTHSRPHWPATLAGLAPAFDRFGLQVIRATTDEARPAAPAPGLRARRRSAQVRHLRERLMHEICGGSLTGSRFDTLVCDAWLPLLAARDDTSQASARNLAIGWRIWTPGDAPAELLRLAREYPISDDDREPLGQGDLQGLLGWLSTLPLHEGRGA